MDSEITNFCIENNCKPNEVEIHHKHSCGDNKKENLEVMTFKQHRALHNK